MISVGSNGFPFFSTIFVNSVRRFLNSLSSDLSLLTNWTIELSISFNFFNVLLSTVNWPSPMILTIFVLLIGSAIAATFFGLVALLPPLVVVFVFFERTAFPLISVFKVLLLFLFLFGFCIFFPLIADLFLLTLAIF